MNRILASLVLITTAGLASAQTYVTNTVPGGTFDPGFDTSYWTNNAANTNTVFSYPTTGGNPDGYALMDSSAPGTDWGVFVGAVYDGSNSGEPIPMASLGLSANIPCTILMDMKIEAGNNIGGLKMESYDSSNILIGGSDKSTYPSSGTTNWVTYSFPYTPSANATGIKFVPLWGPSSSVGYDNVRVIATTALPLSAAITSPTNTATVGTNYTITASASVLPGSVTNVSFYDGAVLLGSDQTLPYSWTITGASEGAAALTVVAEDDNGNSVTSAVVNVTVAATTITNTFEIDTTAGWYSFMRVRYTPGGVEWFTVPGWGVNALTAVFSGYGSNSVLSLRPAIVDDPSNQWYDYSQDYYPTGMSGAVGFPSMEASYYVEPAGVNGNFVTFTGNVLSHTLVDPGSTNLAGNGWESVAFIKDFAPDYSSFNETTLPLTNGGTFSISLQTDPDPARHIQYGFLTVGPNIWSTDTTNFGEVLLETLPVPEPTNFVVDSSSPWVGYMNVANTPQDGGAYQFGSGWGTADLVAVFGGFGLTLAPNTIGDPDPYWYTPSGGPGSVGNKIMDASMYVEIGSFPFKNVTFSGVVLSNTLVSASNTNAAGNGWTSVAFIKDFAPDYSSVNAVTVPLTPGAFSISLVTANDPNRHVQYGFETIGPDVWVTDVAPYGNVLIENVGVLPASITPSLSGGNINLSFPTQMGKGYTVQYKDSITDTSWSTLTTTNGTGLTVVIPDPANNAERYYRLSVQK